MIPLTDEEILRLGYRATADGWRPADLGVFVRDLLVAQRLERLAAASEEQESGR